MLIKDGAVIQSHAEKLVVERTRDITQKALVERIQNESISTGADAMMDMTNEESRWGRRMDVQAVIQNLQRMNSNLSFEVSRACSTLMGVYVTEWTRDEATGGSSYGRRYVMAMENGIMPEFTIVKADTVMLPDPNEPVGKVKVKQFAAMKRGWRAVLVTLLREGIIQVHHLQSWSLNLQEGQESRVWRDETQGTERLDIGGSDHGSGQFQYKQDVAGTGTGGIDTGTVTAETVGRGSGGDSSTTIH